MEAIQAIVLFVLGVGAAFLAYFAWQHVSLTVVDSSQSMTGFVNGSPAISTQA